MKKKAANKERIVNLIKMLASENDPKRLERILSDLCSPSEMEAMADRYFVLPMIAAGVPYRQIHAESQVSITTIGRVARHWHDGHGGYAALVDKIKEAQ